MQRSTLAIVLAAAFAAGCSAGGSGPDDGDGVGSGSGSAPGSGSGASTGNGGSAVGVGGAGTAGTGAGPSTGSSSGTGASSSSGGSGGSDFGGMLPACAPGVPVTSQVPRLLRAQYDNAVRDLLKVTTLTAKNNVSPSTLLAPDQEGSLDMQGWSAIMSVGAAVAEQAMKTPESKAMFLNCATTTTECITASIESFGRKAFRRALTADEKARFGKLVTDGASITENGTPDEVAQVVLTAFLLSPSFLMRAEITEKPEGAGFALSSDEVASRLAFMLTGTIPDETLRAEADKGALTTPEQISAQAVRLMGTVNARATAEAFHQFYLRVDDPSGHWQQAGGTGKDPRFAGFTKELAPVLMDEEKKLFDYITFEQPGTFKDLLLTDVAFVTDQTAPFYGLTGSFGSTLTQTKLDASRPGFLTRLGFLANFADFGRTNPIYRGAFITKEVMGVDPGNPVPGAANTKLPDASADLNTNRKRVAEMTKEGSCGECHTPYVNPPGFALEAFDAVGAVQTTEYMSGAAIDTTADIILDKALPPVHVAGAAEMMAQIAASPLAHKFYATKLVSFGYGRSPNSNDACVADTIGQSLQSGGTIKDAFVKLTTTDSFRLRMVGSN